MKEIILSSPPFTFVSLTDHSTVTHHHGLLQYDERRVLRRPIFEENLFCFSRVGELYSDHKGIHESKSRSETIKKALESCGRVFAFKSFEDALRWALEK